MNCPKCGTELIEKEMGGIDYMVCKTCKYKIKKSDIEDEFTDDDDEDKDDDYLGDSDEDYDSGNDDSNSGMSGGGGASGGW
jgi:DNA-directed RNA polymerase subunit M/transcription elongation factor TFIIS